jgi:hypothetical protein
MSKKDKIAESIIIRVGGGIREVIREPFEVSENLESVHREPDFEQTEDVQSYGTELGSKPKIGPDKIVN